MGQGGFPSPDRPSFFSKNPHTFKSGGRKKYRKSNYRNPLFCRYVILTHGISKMAETNEPDHELYAFSTDFFTFIRTKSCELARGRLYPRGYQAFIELIEK